MFSGSPLTTSDFITASFTLASALPANLTDANEIASVSRWAISDQVTALSQSAGDPLSVLSIWTDAEGNIANWFFDSNLANTSVDFP
jgi:hypothetical protein